MNWNVINFELGNLTTFAVHEIKSLEIGLSIFSHTDYLRYYHKVVNESGVDISNIYKTNLSKTKEQLTSIYYLVQWTSNSSVKC